MIYLDNNATTPVDLRVKEAMLPYLGDNFGNPSSAHSIGRAARKAMDMAREQVGRAFGAGASSVVFTSGGTEAINMALRGAMAAQPHKRHIVTTMTEHSATKVLCEQLMREGYEVTWLKVDSAGQPDFGEYLDALREDTGLVTMLWANNETGAILPIEAMAHVAEERRIVFHADAVQAAGKIPIDLKKVPVHLLSISGHKFHGPKGSGALIVRSGLGLPPMLLGGGQENGRRSGTENVPGIVGMGVAAELANAALSKEIPRVAEMRDVFESGVREKFPDSKFRCADKTLRLANTSNFSLVGVRMRDLLPVLDHLGLICSMGSACSSGRLNASHVLRAMGISEEDAQSSLRISFSRMNTMEEVPAALAILEEAIKRGNMS